MEMRELRGDDLFSLLGIIGKLDVKDDFIKLFQQNDVLPAKVVPLDHKKKEPTKKEKLALEKAKLEQEKAIEKRGMEIVANLLQTVLRNIKSVRRDVNELLADLTGESVTAIQNLSLGEYTALLVAFFKKPELNDFFKSIASLMK